MTTAVLDTNTLASGFVGFAILTSTPGEILRLWRAGVFALVVSAPILVELGRVLRKPYFAQRLTEADVRADLELLMYQAIVAVALPIPRVASHPEDDIILATAASARANYLVTGDSQLQRLGSYQGVQVVSPRDFLTLLPAGIHVGE